MENYNEMYHHGVKGMRWGVRRYQNKDGTMTAYGKKRYAREMAKLDAEEKALKNRKKTAAQMAKLDKKKQTVEELKKKVDSDKEQNAKKSTAPTKPTEKSVKDMTDAELSAKIERLKLEQKYEELLRGSVNNTSNNSSNNSAKGSSNSDKKEKGKAFAKKYLSDAGKKIIWDTSVDLAAQTAKHLLAKQINNTIDARNTSGERIDAVFSNNKRK